MKLFIYVDILQVYKLEFLKFRILEIWWSGRWTQHIDIF